MFFNLSQSTVEIMVSYRALRIGMKLLILDGKSTLDLFITDDLSVHVHDLYLHRD